MCLSQKRVSNFSRNYWCMSFLQHESIKKVFYENMNIYFWVVHVEINTYNLKAAASYEECRLNTSLSTLKGYILFYFEVHEDVSTGLIRSTPRLFICRLPAVLSAPRLPCRPRLVVCPRTRGGSRRRWQHSWPRERSWRESVWTTGRNRPTSCPGWRRLSGRWDINI